MPVKPPPEVEPSEAEIDAMAREAASDSEWFNDRFQSLRQEHPDMFVVVKGGDLIAVAKTYEEAVNATRKAGQDPARVLIEFLPKEDRLLIL